MEYVITSIWDNAASVWIATSSDIPGFVLEDCSYDNLLERIKIAVPDLIEQNGEKPRSYSLVLRSECNVRI